MPIEWTKDLATGVEAIDEQHKELFRRINLLLDACRRGEGAEHVVSTLAFLTQYVVEHFQSEEDLMRRAAYRGYAEHAAMHREFRKRVESFASDLALTGVTIITVITVNRMIVDWLNDHIRTVDRAMAATIREQAPHVLARKA